MQNIRAKCINEFLVKVDNLDELKSRSWEEYNYAIVRWGTMEQMEKLNLMPPADDRYKCLKSSKVAAGIRGNEEIIDYLCFRFDTSNNYMAVELMKNGHYDVLMTVMNNYEIYWQDVIEDIFLHVDKIEYNIMDVVMSYLQDEDYVDMLGEQIAFYAALEGVFYSGKVENVYYLENYNLFKDENYDTIYRFIMEHIIEADIDITPQQHFILKLYRKLI